MSLLDMKTRVVSAFFGTVVVLFLVKLRTDSANSAFNIHSSGMALSAPVLPSRGANRGGQMGKTAAATGSKTSSTPSTHSEEYIDEILEGVLKTVPTSTLNPAAARHVRALIRQKLEKEAAEARDSEGTSWADKLFFNQARKFHRDLTRWTWNAMEAASGKELRISAERRAEILSK